ncbi:MAG: UDP-2,3-diacylglucosamine diphosphatase [Gemmatimonadetes bacterium]|nr:UDP-2,3-diacylglucosamine diphosphatase [Gemmatimonadota bacterium]
MSGLDHGVGSLDGAYQAFGFDESQRIVRHSKTPPRSTGWATGATLGAPERKVNQDRRLRASRPYPYTAPVPPKAAAVVSDAHLGHTPGVVGATFLAFVKAIPGMADHLVINGDLFDFWFEYRRVIPRDAFPALAALSDMRSRGVRLTVTGGNHDRWGGDFWVRELGADFHAGPVELDLAGRRAFLAHGDGLAESRLLSRVMHRITRHPVTTGAFRLIHPDVGFWLADRLSGVLAEQTKTPAALAQAAALQETFARDLMTRRPDLELVVLGHTHHAVIREVAPGRWYVNSGAWMEGYSYALVGLDGPVLRRFEPSF